VSATLASGARANFGATALAAPPALQIAIFSGNNQSGPAGTVLPQQLIVRVTDGAGTPLANETVTFTVLSGGGSVIASDKTGALGRANTPLTLGTTPGTNTVKATIRTGAFVIFTANGN
jgi:hypothetical protein